MITDIEDGISIDKLKFSTVIRDHNIDKEMITKALSVVKQFIIDRSLIIFGGLAIDYALRLYGSSVTIYVDEELPDYDCISPTNVDDAYDLGEILNNMGYENVKVIRARHPETMRVRINLITVADIGYIPLEYYKQYKTLLYKQMRILHPDIQRLDLHKAYCFPFNNPPLEDIFNRWGKDIVRFNLYEQYYPIIVHNVKYDITEKTYKLPYKLINNKQYAINGFAAYALYYREFIKYSDNTSSIESIVLSITEYTCMLTIPKLPDNNPFIIVTNQPNNEGKYSNILEKIPDHDILSIENNELIIYYVNYLSITVIDDIQVVNIQYLLMYFLFYYNFYYDVNYRKIFGKFYINLLAMINIMEPKQDKTQVFYPSLLMLGYAPLYKPTHINNNLLPINYTPSRANTRQAFNYSNFKLSGEEK